MARVYTKIGDIFSAKLDEKSKKYFQFIASDMGQLNSSVIRVFRKVYPIDATPDLSEVVKGEVEFYAHCVINWGVKLGLWEKVGRNPNVGRLDVLFRTSEDSGRRVGDPRVEVSESWWVWHLNEKHRSVGKLKGENQKAEIGSIIPPKSIVHRMQTGKYDFFYPGY